MDFEHGACAMTRFVSRAAASAVVALFLAAAAPATNWREYPYPEQGFAIQFPAAPKVERSTYRAPWARELPSTVYSVEHENILYRMTVAQLPAGTLDGANYLGEAAYYLMREGEVIFNDIPRVDQAQNGIFGIGMVVDTEDGRRVRSSLYVSKGRFYRADAIVLPARGDKDQAIPSRFDQTLRFNVAR